ncbi:MAG: hypothetical protein QN141_09915 [Armatimonadota bacterium]|nr:hypothetical protein [Armatimonadota bacterium]MDR7451587.1 hypothetical protein [Armatimonadota bacterium]MDR7467693.1 hypothetical protein [Armatimonadota bacterium]MDR7492556.1 hypothetical protein [Armatimonadota bacterium]MDR7500497.1 hypothetical protein [Armatimonadota bacterium]
MRKVNAVARNDLRLRLSRGNAVTLVTVYLSLLAVLALLSLPPDLGRLDDLRQEGLLLAFLVATTVVAVYLTTAAACGEIAIEGEKSVLDLAASPFPPEVVGRGKVLTSAVFAAFLLLLATPFTVIVAGIRGEPLAAAARAAIVTIPMAAALGGLAALTGAVFDSDFARSFVHWFMLLAVIVGAAALPPPWHLLSPVRMVVAAAREGLRWDVVTAAAGYTLLSLAAGAAIARQVRRIRRAYGR